MASTGRGKQDGERRATLSCDPAAAHADVREGSVCLPMEMTPPTTSSSYTYDGDTARFLLCQSSEGLPPPRFVPPSRTPPVVLRPDEDEDETDTAWHMLERGSSDIPAFVPTMSSLNY